MSWLLTAAAVAYAVVIRGGLSVQRGRTAKWKDRFERARAVFRQQQPFDVAQAEAGLALALRAQA